MIVKRAYLINKLLKDGKIKYSEELKDFVDMNVLKKEKLFLTINDREFLLDFFKNHCEKILDRLNLLNKKYNVKITDEKTLNDAANLSEYLENIDKNDIDIRHISSKLFQDSKRITHNYILHKIYKYHVETLYNITYIKTDTPILFGNLDILEITIQNGYFSLFVNNMTHIKTSAEKIVIFENLKPFFRLKPKNALFIYSGGFENASKIGEWLKNFDSEKVHFGDLDPSGLSIAELTIGDNGKFFPDINIIKLIIQKDRFQNAERNYQENYRNNLLNEIARYMKSYNLRIEQEYVTNLICSKEIATPEWCVI
ncbi:DUF7281 domain-containing protein [Calditerrivibrio nitroreducens]|uniref:DUF7281 domain-containing protein n=1 Tax=Calditerrivibrio nitroreducens (strain DSM 19672 / NBRC 101217 / Yu37-1) TaxID=768670 RepID=E4TFQ3_CALNY|nr:Wadjet anti-phage system protein JetD domain-containing protein [Calditerrivibrio nitroreducens]ADR18521.1 hypothetical protein Calni_0609 [Calditerrivibrio nitroreducens DSM 19672]